LIYIINSLLPFKCLFLQNRIYVYKFISDHEIASVQHFISKIAHSKIPLCTFQQIITALENNIRTKFPNAFVFHLYTDITYNFANATLIVVIYIWFYTLNWQFHFDLLFVSHKTEQFILKHKNICIICTSNILCN